jgi:hypothetical protein
MMRQEVPQLRRTAIRMLFIASFITFTRIFSSYGSRKKCLHCIRCDVFHLQ